eukprot:gene7222-9196_t
MLEQLEDSDINAMLAVNISAPICLTKILLPLLKQASSAMVVNVGSTYGSIGYPGYASYCASKFALRGFSEALRRELSDTRVGVLYVAPRATSTPMNSPAAQALNDALNANVDDPQTVASAVIRAIAGDHREPTMNGIGADAFCILWDGKQLVGLNAHGHSPALMTPDQYAGLDKMPHVGWGSVTTPGAVSLWMELHKRYGKLPFADLFEPAIKYAHDGFRVSYMVAHQWHRAIDRLKGQESWVK